MTFCIIVSFYWDARSFTEAFDYLGPNRKTCHADLKMEGTLLHPC
jgi:hypothetical protein